MADEQNREEQTAGEGSGSQEATGDPGRTPDKAEGSEENVDESLRRQGGQ